MATFTTVISNTVNVFGPEPATLWGTAIWGTSKWAYGSYDLPVSFQKFLSNQITLSDTTNRTGQKIIDNTVNVTADMAYEGKMDANGYRFIFGSSDNAENRPDTSYNRTSESVTSFTSAAIPTTSWTRV